VLNQKKNRPKNMTREEVLKLKVGDKIVVKLDKYAYMADYYSDEFTAEIFEIGSKSNPGIAVQIRLPDDDSDTDLYALYDCEILRKAEPEQSPQSVDSKAVTLLQRCLIELTKLPYKDVRSLVEECESYLDKYAKDRVE